MYNGEKRSKVFGRTIDNKLNSNFHEPIFLSSISKIHVLKTIGYK